MNHSKIAIIGAGRVGATTAYALMLKNIAAEILLVDIDPIRCKGELLDLEDVLPFCATSTLRDATVKQAAQADIIIITAGIAQKPGQKRIELLEVNTKIMDTIAQELSPINPQAIIIVVSNPVDILTLHLHTKNLVSDKQLFGAGTFLDSMRLTQMIAQRFNIATKSVHAWIVGEHGENQFPVWSDVTIDGTPIAKLAISAKDLDELAQRAKQKAFNILDCKGSTFFGIATCLVALCESIIFNQHKIFPVSLYHPDYGICMSLPCIIGQQGIEETVSIPFNELEKEQLCRVVANIKKEI